MAAQSQVEAPVESRTERASVTLTKSEKESLRLVAMIDETDESSLLRDSTIAQIMARAEEIRARLKVV